MDGPSCCCCSYAPPLPPLPLLPTQKTGRVGLALIDSLASCCCSSKEDGAVWQKLARAVFAEISGVTQLGGSVLVLEPLMGMLRVFTSPQRVQLCMVSHESAVHG